MTHICLIGDTKSQMTMPALAENLFRSVLFNRAKAYAKQHAHAWYILSAHYGLVAPDTLIRPYTTTIDDLPSAERFQIATQIMSGLIRHPLTKNDSIIVLAKSTYREVLAPVFKGRNITAEYPLEGKGVVEQLRWLEAAVR